MKNTKTRRTRTLDLPDRKAAAPRRHRAALAEDRLMIGDRWPARWSSLVFVSEAGTPMHPGNVRRLILHLAAEAGIVGTARP